MSKNYQRQASAEASGMTYSPKVSGGRIRGWSPGTLTGMRSGRVRSSTSLRAFPLSLTDLLWSNHDLSDFFSFIFIFRPKERHKKSLIFTAKFSFFHLIKANYFQWGSPLFILAAYAHSCGIQSIEMAWRLGYWLNTHAQTTCVMWKRQK